MHTAIARVQPAPAPARLKQSKQGSNQFDTEFHKVHTELH
jgi:hypothetical protein